MEKRKINLKLDFSLIKLVVFFICFNFISCQDFSDVGRNNYEYILPPQRVTSCPSFASFRFSCKRDHVIAVETVIFSPPLMNAYGECASDPNAECIDNQAALLYAQEECSNSEHCTLISYQLRSRTKCEYHNVISVIYRCVPTWEVTDVPIKCDICKNVTITNVRDNYGFIHSAWYPKLYPRVTCHSLVKTQPDKLIIIYSVAGSVGLDRIQVESVNQFGQLVSRETLTGNLTTKRIIVSPYDVNITVLPEDTYFFDQRRFLFYFYLVPRCNIIYCPGANYTTASHSYPPYTTPELVTTTPVTMAPPLKGSNTTKISDAWLAAILALVYSILMVFAVLTAIYCRRRRRERLLKEAHMYNERIGASSSAQIIPQQISRVPSQVSMTRPVSNGVYLASPTTEFDLYGQMEKEEQFENSRRSSMSKVSRNIPIVMTAGDYESSERVSGNQVDLDVIEHNEMFQHHNQHQYSSNSETIASINVPYSIKTNTQMGSIVGSSNTGDSMKSIYRAVEYTKSPKMERVRVKNSEDSDEYEEYQIAHGQLATYRYKIDARNQPIRVTNLDQEQVIYSEAKTQQNHHNLDNSEDEKTFVVKLFPIDENEKEVQEMTMFVESNERKY